MLDSESRWALVKKLKAKAPKPASEPIIRNCELSDLPQIRDIYNYYIRNTVVTFDEEPLELSDWEDKFGLIKKQGLPFLVMLSDSGEVLGFAYCAPWRQKSAYKKTVENSIYLSAAATGRKLGGRLLEALITYCQEAGIKEIIAVIADRGAEASIRLHRKYGFADQGHLAKVGVKFGKPVGTYLMQLSIK